MYKNKCTRTGLASFGMRTKIMKMMTSPQLDILYYPWLTLKIRLKSDLWFKDSKGGRGF